MPQLYLYVDDALADLLQQRAHASGLSLSRYLAGLAQREASAGWPAGWFDEVLSAWQGPLEREDPGPAEERQALGYDIGESSSETTIRSVVAPKEQGSANTHGLTRRFEPTGCGRSPALRYLLDTNTAIRLLRGPSSALVAELRARSPQDISLCAVVKAELLYDARRSARVAENLALVERFSAPFVCHPFDDDAAEHYGAIRAELAAAGRPIGPNDLMLAAIARARDLTLVSHDAEFRRVVGLRVVDWGD